MTHKLVVLCAEGNWVSLERSEVSVRILINLPSFTQFIFYWEHHANGVLRTPPSLFLDLSAETSGSALESRTNLQLKPDIHTFPQTDIKPNTTLSVSGQFLFALFSVESEVFCVIVL